MNERQKKVEDAINLRLRKHAPNIAYITNNTLDFKRYLASIYEDLDVVGYVHNKRKLIYKTEDGHLENIQMFSNEYYTHGLFFKKYILGDWK